MFRLLLFVAGLAAATAAAAAPTDVAEFERLKSNVESLRATVEALRTNLHALRADRLRREGAAPGRHGPGRRLSEADDSPVTSLAFQHPDASLAFAQGASLAETDVDGTPALHARSHVVVDKDVHVKGSLHVDGANLNLGMPLNATEPLSRGDIVSMVSSGGVAKGFGMAVSASLTSAGVAASSLVILRHSDTIVTVLRTDASGELWATYFDSALSASEAPRSVTFGEAVDQFTGAALANDQLLVCYRKLSTMRGYCRAALYTGRWTFDETIELELHTQGEYHTGVLVNLRGQSDRAVLVYTMTDPDGNVFNAQVVSVSGQTASVQSLPLNLPSSRPDHLSAVSMTGDRIIIAFRVVQDRTSKVQELYFSPGDPNIRKFSAVDITLDDVADFTHTALARLDDNRVLLAFRSPQDGYRVQSAVVDASLQSRLTVGPLATVDSGTFLDDTGGLLRLSVTAPTPSRVGFAFLNGNQLPVFTDAAVFGDSIVVGRAQSVDKDGATASAVAAVEVAPFVSIAVQQPESVTNNVPAWIMRTTMYGGTTMLGLAAHDAAAGEPVTVVLQGALDSYTGLQPGAPYYARYDGGMGDEPREVGGTSTAVVGTAITPTTLLSSIGSTGDDVKQFVASVAKDVAGSRVALQNLEQHRSCEIYDTFKDTHYLRHDLPVFRWALWNSYSQNFGWLFDNTEYDVGEPLIGGVSSWKWSDGDAMAWDIPGNKSVWASLFNKRMYGHATTMVWAEEYRYASSTNSRRVGTLFRIRNVTPQPIMWTMKFKFTSYGEWAERASVTMNGNNTWFYHRRERCWFCEKELDLEFRPLSNNTIITISTASYGTGNNMRTISLLFYDDCLRLPEGLEWVDDLHHHTEGGWDT